MTTTFMLKNNGDQPSADILLQVSYFTKLNEEIKVESKNYGLVIKAGEEKIQVVDFLDSIVAEEDVTIIVKKKNGSVVTQQSFQPKAIEGQRISIGFNLNKEVELETADAPSESSKPSFVYGRLLDKKGIKKMEEIQIIILVKKREGDDFEPLTSVSTETQGYFTIEYPAGVFTEAVAQIGIELSNNPILIKLEEKPVAGRRQGELVFPRRLILVADIVDNTAQQDDDCDCGCNSLSLDSKRVLEEFSFYSLVRTSEPEIKGFVIEDEEEITLEDVLKNLPVSIFELVEPLKALPFIVRSSPIKPSSVAAKSRAAGNEDDFLETIKSIKIQKEVLSYFLKEEKTINKENIGKLFSLNEASKFQKAIEPATKKKKALGRVVLNANNAVDWDDEPTIYQAVEVAHGHLLQYVSEWVADGYSLGDLLYSLPLAPGQKKQIVVFDWERRESASNIQSIDFEESLFNSLTRDRDVFEIAKGTVQENISGRSRSTTGGAALGVGGEIKGVVFGVSGGFGTSNSSASQDSLRKVSSSDQQKLRDRIVQSANAVRSLRSTVIQSVAQGERFEVSAESVANYNHCHAITIQYYEVLRHFKIRQRFASARECLFVPLLMSTFDLKKALRWREALQSSLIDKRFVNAFDAGDRVMHEWEESNFPSGTFASENILTASGELQIRFVIQRPADDVVEVDDTSRPVVTRDPTDFLNTGKTVTTYPFKKRETKFNKDNWESLKPILGSVTPEQFYDSYLAKVEDKDEAFHRELGEKIVLKIVDSLLFYADGETTKSTTPISVDATLVSRYRRDGVLKVTVRLSPSALRRDSIYFLRMGIMQIGGKNLRDILPDGSFITVESGFIRYKTRHFDGFIFKYPRIGDDLLDGVTVYAGPSNEELRDPRKDDIALVNKLISHLNDNLEEYHRRMWENAGDQKRFMWLDGIILNGKGEGRSLASLVENELIAVVGNSLVFPVAPGLNLDPGFGLKESLTDFYMVAASDPISVSVPTKGVFAEAVMGNCNSCEKIEDDRFWRWEESPIPDSPTAINPINTDTRRSDPVSIQPQTLPNPIVNIQNAPNAPDPTGLASTISLLGQSGVFKDITGLEGNQRNAIQAFQSSLETAKAFGQQATNLEVQKTMEKRLDKALNAIENDKSLSPEKKAELKEKAINAYMGAGAVKEEKKEKEQPKPTLTDAAIKASEVGKSVKAATSDGKGATTEIEIGAEDSSVSSRSFILDDKINANLRAFRPSENDKTGVITLSVSVPRLPAGGRVKWSIPPQKVGNTGTYTMTQINKAGKVFDVEIKGITPGNTEIDVEVIDSNDTVKESQKYKLNIPQFVRIAENAARFDAALTTYNISHLKDGLVRKIRIVAESLLRDCNVRMLWNINPFNEIAPAHLPADRITTATFLDSSAAAPGSVILGATFAPLGSDVFNETIELYPLGFLDSADTDEETKAIVRLMQGQISSDPQIESFVLDVLSRLFGETLSHEIIHSLLGDKIAPVSGGSAPFHNEPPIENDIMNAGLFRGFKQRTGLELQGPIVDPIKESDFTDSGIGAIGGLQDQNMEIMRTVFPVNPD